jgi:hypothetical protein
MSQALVPCTVARPSGEDADRPTGTVMAKPIESLTPASHVPTTLVEMDREVLISITNFGMHALHIGSDTPIAALENFDSLQEITCLPGSKHVCTTPDIADRDLPEHLQTLFERSVADLPDVADRIAIHEMLVDFADVFIGPDGQLGLCRQSLIESTQRLTPLLNNGLTACPKKAIPLWKKNVRRCWKKG